MLSINGFAPGAPGSSLRSCQIWRLFYSLRRRHIAKRSVTSPHVVMTLAAVFFALTPYCNAQTARNVARITAPIDETAVIRLSGNTHPLARREFDQGRADRSMPMRVTMVFKMTLAQRADLDELLAAQQHRGSPDYQRWLTPEQFGSRFGLSQGDIDKVTGWLRSAGFHVEGVPASRNMITFSGTAQQVESALHTEIHQYTVKGQLHYANASEPRFRRRCRRWCQVSAR
jgi:hypothetical protein